MSSMHHSSPSLLPSVALPSLRQRGFSIIELMVVIVILGVLASIIVPSVLGRIDKSKIAATKTSLNAVSAALDEYKMDNNHYPSTAEGLAALTTAVAGAKNFPEGGYLKLKKSQTKPQDGWQNDLQYSLDGRVVSLYSFGADGAAGGEGSDADIFYDE